MEININPKKELFKWGPIDGRLIYVDYFMIAFARFARSFASWPDVLGLFYKGKMLFILDNEKTYESGKKNFRKYILPDKNFKRYYGEWQNTLRTFIASSKEILRASLPDLNNSDLIALFEEWSEKYFRFWTIGELPEVANWGAEEILKERLQAEVPVGDFNLAYERLSAPTRLSFYQQAELDLLKLREKTKGLRGYQQKYFWILNSYHHTQILSVEYFKKELLKYSPAAAKKKIRELEKLGANVKKEKQRLIKKYYINPKTVKIARRLSFCVWWQDRRKYYIFLANHVINLFMEEFAKRNHIKLKDLPDYSFREILALIKNGKKISKSKLSNRLFYYSARNNSLHYQGPGEAKKALRIFSKPPVSAKITQLRGLAVSRGKTVTGAARIITSPSQIGKMKRGDILVAPMTSPDYILAMKRAAAIVTDHGGLTSHAAIVARELKIPCIVGTKTATHILRDGDTVEVDAEKGAVNIIK